MYLHSAYWSGSSSIANPPELATPRIASAHPSPPNSRPIARPVDSCRSFVAGGDYERRRSVRKARQSESRGVVEVESVEIEGRRAGGE
jgi:hypothetical protein